MREYGKLFINGEWIAPTGGGTIDVISPASEEVIGRVPEAGAEDVDKAIAAARTAFDEGPWPHMSGAERADCMARVTAALGARTQEIGELVSNEMGTPISISTMVQASMPIMFFNYYVDLARSYEFEEIRKGMMGSSLVAKEGVGVVGAIVPWNYPLYLTMAKLGPAFAAGCTVVLKPASEAPLNAHVLAECIEEAGLPPGVFNMVPGAGRVVGNQLVEDPRVDKISFTGSTEAGRAIMSKCGEQIKRVTLELGGKSACILLDDAPLDMAIPTAAQAAMLNSGQTCIAQTRLLAPRSTYDDVVARMTETVSQMKVGEPLDPTTTLGPLVSGRQRDIVEGYVNAGQEEGAKITTGGGRPSGFAKGYYVEPTVFAGVDNKMRIAQEEIFGPVLSVIPYDTVDEAVAIANDSIYGLSGGVWAGDPEKGLDVAKRIRTGTMSVNTMGMNLAAPFGGYKQSGIGRELGPEGILPYIEFKSIALPGGFTPAGK